MKMKLYSTQYLRYNGGIAVIHCTRKGIAIINAWGDENDRKRNRMSEYRAYHEIAEVNRETIEQIIDQCKLFLQM